MMATAALTVGCLSNRADYLEVREALLDRDGDGFPYVETDNPDCDDADPATYPGAQVRCNGNDNDCDGEPDSPSPVDALTWYVDADQDGFGSAILMQLACSEPTGFVANDSDCDDNDGDINPLTTWYGDSDDDGYGNPDLASEHCEDRPGYVRDSADCDDGDAEIHPGAAERCNQQDDDCDGTTDEETPDSQTWYQDSDSDGFGNEEETIQSCAAPDGYVGNSDDCDDGAEDTNPSATEQCGDAIDNDCSLDAYLIEGADW